MKLKIYKSLWGMEGALEEQFKRIKDAGYDGIEAAAQEIADPALFRSLLKEYGFDFIALVYTEGSDHEGNFLQVVENALQYQPSKIVAHAGRDLMPFVRQVRFFLYALRVEEQFGVPIAHETHRRRPFFSPMNTLAVLRELPELKLNIDFSHWCCVTESMLQDHEMAIDVACEHAIHLHGRVGYENGPQVPDPRVAEWSQHVKLHADWWNKVIDCHRARKVDVFTFTPEYGPPSYMHTQPSNGEPIADLWDICLWTAERFRKQFEGAN
jgi:hypothetical protein